MVRRGLLCAGACLAVGLSSPAGAHEYCVTCEGPPAMYRCVVEGTPDGPGEDPRASLYCISEMATRGRHERCAVSRGAPHPCPGLTATVAQPAPIPPGMAAPAPDTARPPAAPEGAEPAVTAETPEDTQPAQTPRTMEELAGQTMKSSKEGLDKAGRAIGGTAKKAGEQIGNAGSAIGNAASATWTCITSLFSSCGGEATAAPEPEPEFEFEQSAP